MATRQTSKQAKAKSKAKSKAKVNTGATNRADRKRDPEPKRRTVRAGSRSVAAQIDRAGATAAPAPEASSDNSAVVHEKPEQAHPRSKPISEHADLGMANVAGAEQPRASTKRAVLIGMLERPEGASVAEIGQQLGWLPHTVRAAITGLRHAGRLVTRTKNAEGRSVYRLASLETAER